jgi:ParB family chromosome partitioning protein
MADEIHESTTDVTEVHATLPISQIVLGKNVRREIPDVSGMIETVKQKGILLPVPVRKFKDADGKIVPNKYELIDGARRYHAAKGAGLKEIPVHFKDIGDAELHETKLIANLQRADMTPLEKAEGVEVMLNGDEKAGIAPKTQKEIAQTLGVTEGFVSQHLSLLKLPNKVRNAISLGKLDLSQARALGRLKDHEEKMLELLPVAENMTAAEISTKIDLFLDKEKSKAEKKEAKALKKGDVDDTAAPAKRGPKKKSLAERYAEAELTPLGKNAARDELKAMAMKMEKATSDEAHNKYKWMLAGMEVIAGYSD